MSFKRAGGTFMKQRRNYIRTLHLAARITQILDAATGNGDKTATAVIAGRVQRANAIGAKPWNADSDPGRVAVRSTVRADRAA